MGLSQPERAVDAMRDEFLVFGKPVIGEAEIAEVVDSMRSGWVGTGPKVGRFERALEEYVGVDHVRCVSSCTAALILALRALDVVPGDEVILPSMTFIASANAVEHSGATPVLVDSEPDTGLIDLDAVEAAITPRTRAVMPVHLAGRPVDLDRLGEVARRHDIEIVEDAAHAIGTEWRGKRIGSHGNLAAYSFYVTKNVTTFEGGALATSNPEVAARVERLALHGLSLGAWQRYTDRGFKHYEVEEPGFKFNMTDVQAGVGIHQLARLDEWIDRRTELWEAYDADLAELPLRLPAPATSEMRHARHLYQVEVQDESPLTRDELMEALLARNIGAGVHYRGVHLHPFYRDRYGIAPGALPVAEDISARTLSLPLGPSVSDDDRADVVGAIHAALAV